MVSFILVATVLASVGFGSALPQTPKIGTTSHFDNVGVGKTSISQVRRPHYHFNGAVSVYKTYLKYGVSAPEALRVAVENLTAGSLGRRDQGSVSATPIDTFDDAYVSPVKVGTPAQVLNLDFDSGSSDFWVFSSETPKSQVKGQAIYTPGASSTSQKISGASWSVTYGDGSTSSGDVYLDQVDIGGVVVDQQAVEAAQRVSSSFTSTSDIDGLVGLGFDSLNSVRPTRQKTFFTNAMATLDSPVITVDLKQHAAGKYNFGYIDSSAHSGTITYTSVNTDDGFWTFTSSGYAIGSSSFSPSTITGIADTGTTLLYLPTSIVQAYYRQVKNSRISSSDGGYVFPCSSKLSTFTFGVGSARFTIPADYLNYGPIRTGSSTCFGGLQSSARIGTNIFGDVALKAAFVVFNGDNPPSLGWAHKPLN